MSLKSLIQTHLLNPMQNPDRYFFPTHLNWQVLQSQIFIGEGVVVGVVVVLGVVVVVCLVVEVGGDGGAVVLEAGGTGGISEKSKLYYIIHVKLYDFTNVKNKSLYYLISKKRTSSSNNSFC